MPVQHVEFVLGHTVDEAEEGANGEEVARLRREREKEIGILGGI